MTTIPSPTDVLTAMSPGGGWTRATLAEWGVPWPPPKGWRRDLVRQWLALTSPPDPTPAKLSQGSDRPPWEDDEATAEIPQLAQALAEILGERPATPCPVCGEAELLHITKGSFEESEYFACGNDDGYTCLVCDAHIPATSWTRRSAVNADRRAAVLAALLAAHPDDGEPAGTCGDSERGQIDRVADPQLFTVKR